MRHDREHMADTPSIMLRNQKKDLQKHNNPKRTLSRKGKEQKHYTYIHTKVDTTTERNTYNINQRKARNRRISHTVKRTEDHLKEKALETDTQ